MDCIQDPPESPQTSRLPPETHSEPRSRAGSCAVAVMTLLAERPGCGHRPAAQRRGPAGDVHQRTTATLSAPEGRAPNQRAALVGGGGSRGGPVGDRACARDRARATRAIGETVSDALQELADTSNFIWTGGSLGYALTVRPPYQRIADGSRRAPRPAMTATVDVSTDTLGADRPVARWRHRTARRSPSHDLQPRRRGRWRGPDVARRYRRSLSTQGRRLSDWAATRRSPVVPGERQAGALASRTGPAEHAVGGSTRLTVEVAGLIARVKTVSSIELAKFGSAVRPCDPDVPPTVLLRVGYSWVSVGAGRSTWAARSTAGCVTCPSTTLIPLASAEVADVADPPPPGARHHHVQAQSPSLPVTDSFDRRPFFGGPDDDQTCSSDLEWRTPAGEAAACGSSSDPPPQRWTAGATPAW